MNDFTPPGKNLDSINRNTPPKILVSSTPPAPKEVNLITARQSRNAGKILKKIFTVLVLLIIFLTGVLALRAADLSSKIFVGQKTTFFGKIVDFIRGGGDNGKLIGQDLGQINVLLLGIGGEGHDGPYLTDTMILAEIRPDVGNVTLVSIPRDYWINSPYGQGQEKINQAFSDGYVANRDWDEAGRWARQAVQDLTGQQVPYFAVVDFSGFEQAVGQIGGLDIKIDHTFTDSQYPDNGVGYLPPITFTAGLEHMDGVRALEFARSRHSNDPIEGSDFARSLRQQKIIEAFKQKVLSLNVLGSPSKVNSLLDTFAGHFHTNISPSELYQLYSLTKSIKNFGSVSLGSDISLICPQILPQNGAYVLQPCPGKSEADIKNFFKEAYSLGQMNNEKSVIWLSNSTKNQQALNEAQTKLQNAGFTVWQLPYSGQALPQNIFYQVNPRPASAEFIKNELDATEVTLPPPGVNADKNKVDIVIILGNNN